MNSFESGVKFYMYIQENLSYRPSLLYQRLTVAFALPRNLTLAPMGVSAVIKDKKNYHQL